ncbi:RNA polymerase sigma factor SigF [Embleya sp. NPDC050493]|uniref:RNA polymerase sigma factor SigF n=1 Tax=Embleya sp. NPDC050493 TaxID=3363989 RepID=UPI0037B17BCD
MAVQLGAEMQVRGSQRPPAMDTGAEELDLCGLHHEFDEGEIGSMGVADARSLSRTLFQRLNRLEEGTHEYQYVRNTLIELNLPLVRFAAGRFRTRSEPLEDIVQVGTIGLIKAIDRFDTDREVEFPTFAMPTILGEIKRFFRDTTWSVRVPRRLQELRLRLAKASEELGGQLDRAPTVAELAAFLDVSREEIVEGMIASNGYSASSLDAPGGGAGGDDAAVPMDRLGADDDAIELVDNRESLKPLIAALPPREKHILLLRFFGGKTQAEIGEQLGISQMHVSRLLSRTLGTLRAGLLTES